jgi:hypothetical protein
VILVSLCTASAIAAPQESALQLSERIEFLKKNGYRVNESLKTYRLDHSEWRAIGLELKGLLGLRSISPAKPGGRLYYRFRVAEEVFENDAAAVRRMDARRKSARNDSVGQSKERGIERMFRIGRHVYILSTDVASFAPELDRIAAALESSLIRDAAKSALSLRPGP